MRRWFKILCIAPVVIASVVSYVFCEDAKKTGIETLKPEFIEATQLLYKKEVALAIQKLEKVIASDRNDPGAHHNLACAYALSAQYDKAIEEFDKAYALEMSVFKAVILFDKSVVYLNKNMPKESTAAIAQAIGMLPGLREHESVIALKDYDADSMEFPLDMPSYSSHSSDIPDTTTITQKERNVIGEDPYVFEIIKAFPLFFYKSRCSFVFMGMGYFFDKRYPEAKEQFTNALNTLNQPTLLDRNETFLAHYYLGLIELEAGDYRKAISHFEEANELRSDDVFNLKELAWAYFLNREYLKARDMCEKVLELHPSASDEKKIRELFDTINKQYIK